MVTIAAGLQVQRRSVVRGHALDGAMFRWGGSCLWVWVGEVTGHPCRIYRLDG